MVGIELIRASQGYSQQNHIRDSKAKLSRLDNVMAQNTSHAVMSQRAEPSDSPDDFPTPPWATRALLRHVIGEQSLTKMSCLEPACGRGHMSKALAETFETVEAFDAFDYGYGLRRDFLEYPYKDKSFDWIITNPPFKFASEFVLRALPIAREGVAIFARTVFLESLGRYGSIFRHNPPAVFAQFVERVPLVKGRLDQKASTATGYAWFVWNTRFTGQVTSLVWVPPCRKDLETKGDYC